MKFKQDTRGATMVDTFNEAAQQTFSHVLNAIKDLLVSHEHLAREVSNICTIHVNNNNNMNNNGENNNNNNNGTNNSNDDDPTTNNNNYYNIPPQNSTRARTSVNDALRNTPLTPAFPLSSQILALRFYYNTSCLD